MLHREQGSRTSSKTSATYEVTCILYDQAYGEGAPPLPLYAIAEDVGCQMVVSHHPLVQDSFHGVRLFYLTAPTTQIPPSEIETIIAFVQGGGSLLLIMDEEARQSVEVTGVNHILAPFEMKLTPDTPYLHNQGAIAKAGAINKDDREVPFSGGRAVEGGTPFALQLDKEGNPSHTYAAYKQLYNGARIVVMGEMMAALFMGTEDGERLSGVPRDPSKTTYWGKDSYIFMEEVVSWLVTRVG